MIQSEGPMMKKALWLVASVMLTTMTTAIAQQAVPPENAPVPAMPKEATRTGKRVNRIIDMWLKGQPVYYSQISGGGYEQGKQMAATKADYITYEMEHGPLDFKELREFMRGLLEAGPTRTGHKTPAVIVTLPIPGTTDALRANAWMIQQALAAGVHGILLCNAESPEAARLMIEASRYPFAPRVDGLAQGTRGNGSQAYASRMWGVTPEEYMRIAEPWPLNPDGELLFGPFRPLPGLRQRAFELVELRHQLVAFGLGALELCRDLVIAGLLAPGALAGLSNPGLRVRRPPLRVGEEPGGLGRLLLRGGGAALGLGEQCLALSLRVGDPSAGPGLGLGDQSFGVQLGLSHAFVRGPLRIG